MITETEDRRKNLKDRKMFDKAKEKKMQLLSILLLNSESLVLSDRFFLTTVPNGQKYGNTTFKEVSLLRGHVEEFEEFLNIKITINGNKVYIVKN